MNKGLRNRLKRLESKPPRGEYPVGLVLPRRLNPQEWLEKWGGWAWGKGPRRPEEAEDEQDPDRG
jgi:hypothetical protein